MDAQPLDSKVKEGQVEQCKDDNDYGVIHSDGPPAPASGGAVARPVDFAVKPKWPYATV